MIFKPIERIQIKGGIYFRSVMLNKGEVVDQHTHDHDHATYIGSGKARLLIDGKPEGEYQAGDAVEIKGGVKHAFEVLEDRTILACVWPESIGETF